MSQPPSSTQCMYGHSIQNLPDAMVDAVATVQRSPSLDMHQSFSAKSGVLEHPWYVSLIHRQTFSHLHGGLGPGPAMPPPGRSPGIAPSVPTIASMGIGGVPSMGIGRGSPSSYVRPSAAALRNEVKARRAAAATPRATIVIRPTLWLA